MSDLERAKEIAIALVRVEDQFSAKIAKGGRAACWTWQGSITSYGYGQFSLRLGDGTFKNLRAHRAAYILWRGDIPEGLVLDHLCRNRACVNPAHLEPVTPAENNIRGIGHTATNARKTHCEHGHPLSGENLIVFRGRNRTERGCRTCRRARTNAWKARVGYKVSQPRRRILEDQNNAG